ncbi:MAG: hypothetical protein LBJ00_11850 [Planctomycetaceae bacterium]|nr:hypothetical protein [Planctomycetaceae bacterium]
MPNEPSNGNTILPKTQTIAPPSNTTPPQQINTQQTQIPTTAKPNSKTTPILKQELSAESVSSQVLPQVSTREWLVGLDKVDSAGAAEIWRNAIDSVAGFLGSTASIFSKVLFEKPDTFIVVFKNLSTKEYCERELSRLRSALCQTVGKTVQLKLTCEETKPPIETNHPQIRSSQENRAIFESAANNSLVQKISELFRTEIIDAK